MSAPAASQFHLDECLVEDFVPLPAKDTTEAASAAQTEALAAMQWVIDMMLDPGNPHGAIPVLALLGRVLVNYKEFCMGKQLNVEPKMVGSCPTLLQYLWFC